MHGIHHVTAIAGRPSVNIAFYTRILGLRLVKKTVNFDDPGTYHFYYGDENGSPGTILTFFPWENAAPGSSGTGLTQATCFRVPAQSISYWVRRFAEAGVKHDAVAERFGETVLDFSDPEGLSLTLVGVTGAEGEPSWSRGDLPGEHAIRGLHGVTLLLNESGPTGAVLTNVLGFKEAQREGSVVRFVAGNGVGGVVDIHEAKGSLAGKLGRGSVHHVAFRAAADAEQADMARRLVEEHRLRHTEQKDRKYFRSVYFREPGHILFEIATEQPGFTVDEPLAKLGTDLMLPAFLEPRRKQLETVLPPL
jgi:glyoxalase family protein